MGAVTQSNLLKPKYHFDITDFRLPLSSETNNSARNGSSHKSSGIQYRRNTAPSFATITDRVEDADQTSSGQRQLTSINSSRSAFIMVCPPPDAPATPPSPTKRCPAPSAQQCSTAAASDVNRSRAPIHHRKVSSTATSSHTSDFVREANVNRGSRCVIAEPQNRQFPSWDLKVPRWSAKGVATPFQ